MRVRFLASVVAGMSAAAVAVAAPVAAEHGRTHTVHEGQSIQNALNSARPGDTVVVQAGTYRENLAITTDRITLRGKGARLERPANPAPGRCSENFGQPVNPYGICISGVFDRGTGQITREIRGVKVEGFTVGTFDRTGIIAFGATGTVVQDNDVAGGPGDSGYSVLILRSSDSRVVRNRVHGAGGAGIYLGASLDARGYIAHNVATHSGSLGIMVRDSVGGVVEHNLTRDNCMGIGFVDGFAEGTAASWTARDNLVVHNTEVCPGEPDLSGGGIVLAGAHEITVERNVVLDNSARSTAVPYAGGVILTSGEVFGGTELATGNTVRRNVILRNSPADVVFHQAGAGNSVSRNVCGSSQPAGSC